MKKSVVELQVHRKFSEQFKKARVKEYESGQLTIKEISDLYSVAFQNVYRWVYKYSIYNKKKLRIVEYSESNTKKIKDMQDRIKDLERIVGQKQLNIDYLEKMIELAKEKFDIDIKKNSNTSQSGGSTKTDSK